MSFTDRLVSLAYAATLAASQGLATFTQVRAEQLALSKLGDEEIRALEQSKNNKTPIGFNKTRSEES
jgi:hypothetical protein|tara:strand:- start:584 stop:784 length:201 start_codon:yes stop_codon:yes gene_type:complete